MARCEDPQGIELKAVEKHVTFEGKDILEVGCGDGRFTAKYFGKPRSIVAIDPDLSAIRNAEAKIPSRLSNIVRFQVGEAEKLGFPSGSFDVVVFSWSLCCVQDAQKSLREACRVLRTKGRLVNVMPEAVPSFEVAMLKALGGKDPVYQGSMNAFRALVRSVQDGLFLAFDDDRRILFETYFDSVDDLMDWLPSKPGPFNQKEFESIPGKSLNAIKKFAAANLKQDDHQPLRIRDILLVSTLIKRRQ